MVSQQPIRCSSVEVSERGIFQLMGNNPILSIDRERVRDVVLLYGSAARRPIIQIAASLITFGLGVILGFLLLYHFLFFWAARNHGYFNPTLIVSSATLTFTGVYLFRGVLRQCYYLLVKTDKANLKIVFQSSTKPLEISEFINKAQDDLGYKIRVGEAV